MLEPHERKAATLLQHLNAIRNDKAAKRQEQQVCVFVHEDVCLCAYEYRSIRTVISPQSDSKQRGSKAAKTLRCVCMSMLFFARACVSWADVGKSR